MGVWRFCTFASDTWTNGRAIEHQPGEDELSAPDEAEGNLGGLTP